MTGLALGLLLGTGLVLVWQSCWPRQPRERTPSRTLLRLQDELTQAGISASVLTIPVVCAVAGCVVGLLVGLLTAVLPIGVCFGAMAAWLPVGAVRWRARRRRTRLRELWPDVVDNLASAVRAGMSLPEAVSQLAVRGPAELREPFDAFARSYRASGRFHLALDELKASLADPVADRIVESLRIARDVGGSDLGRLLRTLSAFLRDDARTRSELETRQGWTINAARLAVAAPWIVLALLATRPASIEAYGSPTGAMVLGTGAGVSLVAYRLMLRIARLPEDERVLR